MVATSLDPWERLYRLESPRLWRSLLAFSGNRDIASDAMAEAFVQAMARGAEIRDARAWIWTSAFKIAGGYLQQRAAVMNEADVAATTYEMPEPMPQLLAALDTLSPKQRATIVLHDYADRAPVEIARILGMNVATVYVHLSQARARLRDRLKDEDDD